MTVSKFISVMDDFAWGPVMLILLVGTGFYLSFRLGFMQFTRIPYWWKNTAGKLTHKHVAGEGEVTPFQALTTALASLVTGRSVDPRLAMTGEVSLRGEVNPIGGLPEKLMAAQRAGVKRVLIPVDNAEDLRDVPREVTDQLEITPVRTVEEILAICGIREEPPVLRAV